MKFLSRLTKDGQLDLFQCESIKHMTNYLWDACRTYFIFHYFLPFVLLCVVPLISLSLFSDIAANGETTFAENFFLYLSLAAFMLGTGMIMWEELVEVRKRSGNLKKYICDIQNWF